MTGQATDTRFRFSGTVSAELREGVLLVTIDNPPVNATAFDVRQGVMAAVTFLQATENAQAMVLTGAGKTFVGGADITEFGKPAQEPLLPDVFAALEASAKPVIAALNGAALGGGLELALSCHGRIAHSNARLGLPEVNLGLVPGAGGTQLLPRLVGQSEALELIVKGRPVAAGKALKIGLIDALAQDSLIEDAIRLAKIATDHPLRRISQLAVPAVDAGEFETRATGYLKRARGRQAPAEAIALVRLAGELPFAEGVKRERETFLRLRDSLQSKALRHLFFAERACGKPAGLAGILPRPVRTVAIAGTGLMGCGIAVAALNAGYRILALDQTEEAARKGEARIRDLIGQAEKSGRLSPEQAEDQLARLRVTDSVADLAEADLAIEAVFDDLDVKTALFAKLETVLRADAILATNTSYLNPDEIAAGLSAPDRVVGLHFFSPAHIMKLVEVIRCASTAPDVLATTIAFARSLRKIPVVTGVCEGFIGNRIFSAYRTEAESLLEEGAVPQQIDAAMESYGFPMGPFAVFDMAGFEIAWARRKRQAATRDPEAPYFEIPDRLCEAGRLGRKSGRGWYLYPDGKKQVDPEIDRMLADYRQEKSFGSRNIPDTEIVSRLVAAMAREGQAILDEGIAASPGDIDVVLVHGYGFPAHKGGPMFAAANPDTPSAD